MPNGRMLVSNSYLNYFTIVEEGMKIDVRKYPQLRILCWNRPGSAVVVDEEKFNLYEHNWRFVDVDAINERESDLIDPQ